MNDKDKKEFFDKFAMHNYGEEKFLWKTYYKPSVIWQWIEEKKEEWGNEAAETDHYTGRASVPSPKLSNEQKHELPRGVKKNIGLKKSLVNLLQELIREGVIRDFFFIWLGMIVGVCAIFLDKLIN